jgi:hypothetical protein
MNSWRARCLAAAIMLLVMYGHAWATETLPNTPAGMLMFHGSAALLDWLLLCIAPMLLSGRLCNHTQWLCFASICGNFGGWILYMCYAPPNYYDCFMWWLTVAQLVMLFIPDRADEDTTTNHPWFDMVHHSDTVGGGNYP